MAFTVDEVRDLNGVNRLNGGTATVAQGTITVVGVRPSTSATVTAILAWGPTPMDPLGGQTSALVKYNGLNYQAVFNNPVVANGQTLTVSTPGASNIVITVNVT